MPREACWIHCERDSIFSQGILCHASIEHAQSTLADDRDARLSHSTSFLQKMYRIQGIVACPFRAAGSQPGNKEKRTDARSA